MERPSAHRPTETNPAGIYIPPAVPDRAPGPSMKLVWAIYIAVLVLTVGALWLVSTVTGDL